MTAHHALLLGCLRSPARTAAPTTTARAVDERPRFAYALPDGRVIAVPEIDEPEIAYTLEDGRGVVVARRCA